MYCSNVWSVDYCRPSEKLVPSSLDISSIRMNLSSHFPRCLAACQYPKMFPFSTLSNLILTSSLLPSHTLNIWLSVILPFMFWGPRLDQWKNHPFQQTGVDLPADAEDCCNGFAIDSKAINQINWGANQVSLLTFGIVLTARVKATTPSHCPWIK